MLFVLLYLSLEGRISENSDFEDLTRANQRSFVSFLCPRNLAIPAAEFAVKAKGGRTS